MAQGYQRPRHTRKPSDLLGLTGAGGEFTEKREPGHKGPSDENTIDYIKSILCSSSGQPTHNARDVATEAASKPLGELLPPLTSSNAVDVQLYAVIAVILNQFVQSWYNRITPDNEFVAEVVQIIAHCTRGLEGRMRDIDIVDLLLDELPALLEAHVHGTRLTYGTNDMPQTYASLAVRIAQRACSDDASTTNDLRALFHSLRPRRALAPPPQGAEAALEQSTNETAWSQLLVSRVLPLVLPPEDLENPCLHVLVTEIFSEMILRNALCGKASEPWIIWEGVQKGVHVLRPNIHRGRPVSVTSSHGQLENYGLVTNSLERQNRDMRPMRTSRVQVVVQVFWMTVQFVALAWQSLRSLVIALMHDSSIPARQHRLMEDKSPNKVRLSAVHPGPRPNPQHTLPKTGNKRPVLAMRGWTCISTLISIEQRMPWFSGALSLIQWAGIHGPGKVCNTDNILDR
jgi:hypothetical protein